MTSQWWAEPTAGEMVWCHFSDDINPRPKPRPTLILAVFDDDAPQFTVRVAYGTSQRTTILHRGEFSILRDRNPAAYEAAGLSYDTKFDLKQALDLPYTTEWFSVLVAHRVAQGRAAANQILPLHARPTSRAERSWPPSKSAGASNSTTRS